jgi:hypothetical protein
MPSVMPLTSDNGGYITHGVNTGALESHCVRMPRQPAPGVRCAGFVQGAGVSEHQRPCPSIARFPDAECMRPWGGGLRGAAGAGREERLPIGAWARRNSDTAGVIRPVAPTALLSRCCRGGCAHYRPMCAQQGGYYHGICARGGPCYRAEPCSLLSRYS